MLKQIFLVSALGLSLTGCATAAPVEVTRFHLDNPAQSGTIAVEEMTGNQDISLEFRTYAAAVSAELQRAGFTSAPEGTRSDYVALVGFDRSFRPTGTARDDKPVSVEVGGGLGSGGGRRGGTFGGLGVGVGINLSGKPKDIVTSQMQVQIRRRSDSASIWEGRAATQARQGTPDSQPAAAAQKLAAALIGGYPGESGRTIKVK